MAGTEDNPKKAKNSKVLTYLPVGITILVGLVLSMTVFYVTSLWEKEKLKSELDETSRYHISLLKEQNELHLLALESTAAFFAGSVKVERQEFDIYVNVFMRVHTDVHGIAWVPRIPQDRREEFIEAAKTDGLKDFRLTERTAKGKNIPVKMRQEYFPVFYAEPQSDCAELLGLDLSTIPMIQKTMKKSRASGTAAATGKLRLIQEQDEDIVFIIFQPVYYKDSAIESEQDRVKSLEGFVAGFFHPGQIFESTITLLGTAGIDLFVYDTSASPTERFLYGHIVTPQGKIRPDMQPEELLQRDLHYSDTIYVAGRQWLILCRPSEAFIRIHSRKMPWWNLLMGLLLTAIAGGYFASSIRRKEKIEKLVKERTFELQNEMGQRKRADLALRMSEQRFRAIANYTYDWEIWVSPKGQPLWTNPSVERITGYSPQEFLDLPDYPFSIIYEQDIARAKEAFQSALKGETGRQLEFRIIRKDGEVIWTAASWQPIYDEKGSSQGHRVSIRDISDRKQTENDLRDSEERFKRFAESTFEGIVVHDKGIVVDCNNAFARMFGYEYSEMVGIDAFKLVAPESVDMVRKRIQDEYEEPYEAMGRKKDGMTFNMEINARMFEYKGKRIRFAAIRDITEHKKAQQKLQFQLDYRKLVTSISTDFINIDISTLDEGINRALETVSEFFCIDRSYLFMLSDDSRTMTNTHEWCRRGIPPHKDRLKNMAMDSFPWFSERIKQFIPVIVPSVDELGPEADAEKREWRLESIKSLLCVPIVRAWKLIGFVGFDTVLYSKGWTEDEISLLRIIGDIFANAMDRKLTDLQIRQSEERFRSLVETSSDWIWEVDKQGVYTYASPKVKDILGYEPREIIGKTVFDLMPPDESQSIRNIFIEHVKSRKPFDRLENRNLSADGRIVVLETSGVPVFDNQGQCIGFRGMDRDITERKEADEQIRKSEAKYRNLIETMNEGFGMADENYVLTYVNNRWADMLGYSPEEMIGQRLMDLLAEESKGLMSMIIDEQVPQFNHIYDFVWKAKDGHKVYTIVSPQAVLDESGNFKGSFGVITDITDRKKTAKALEESEVRFRNFFENAPIGFHMFGPDRKITDINKDELEMIGYEYDEIVGKKTWADLIIPEQRDNFERHWQDIVTKGWIRDVEYTLVRKDGHLVNVILNTYSRFDDNGNLVNTGGSVLNITERKQAEEDLRDAELKSRTLLEGSPVCNKIIDLDSKLRYMSAAGQKDLKITDINSYYGRTYPSEIYPESVRAPLVEHLQRAMAGEISSVEAPLPDADGNEVWYHTTFVPALDDKGQVEYIIASSVNITDRKQSEEALRKSEEEYRTFLESSHDFLFVKDIHGRYETLNLKTAIGLGGTCIDDIIGKTDYELLPKEQADTIRNNDLKVMDSENDIEVEEIVGVGEGKLYALSHKWPKYNKQGRVSGIRCFGMDITERRKAEEAIKSLAKFPSENSGPVLRIHKSGALLYANPASQPLLTKWDCQVGQVISEQWHETISEVSSTGLEKRVEVQVEDVIFTLCFTPVPDTDYINVYGRDITERKRAENMLQSIIEGTSKAVGEEFFGVLVKSLANAFGFKYGFIGTVSGPESNLVETLAVWAGNGYADNFEYHLAGTPCENVLKEGMCLYPQDVRKYFPEDPLLAKMGVESYLGTPLRNLQGHALGILVVMDDKPMEHPAMAESIIRVFATRASAEIYRRQTEEALRQSEEKYRSVYQMAPLALLLWDFDCHVTAWNKGAQEIFGWSQEEVLGRNFYDFLVPEEARPKVEDVVQAVKNQLPEKTETVNANITKDGRTIICQWCSSALRDSNGNVIGAISLALDITERLRAEKEIRMLNLELEQRVIERTAALTKSNQLLIEEIEHRKQLETDILSVSEREKKLIGQELHESIGQQLTGIAFSAKLLERSLDTKSADETEDAREIGSRIGQAIEQTRRMATGLHPSEYVTANLISAMEEVASTTHQVFGIKCAFVHNDPALVDDEKLTVHLYRLAQEAITNAIKHGRAKNITITLTYGPENSTLTVQSDGIDFPKVTPKRKGLGLGIMNYRAEMINGSFDIRKADKAGTVVTCIFPNK